jgi:RNA polymerase sigma-70 factor (ECF subfamily)
MLVRELPRFRHSAQRGAFRHWLRTITVNRLRAFWRAGRYRPVAANEADGTEALAKLENPASDLSRLWDEERDRHVAHRLLELIEPEFTPLTWQAFRRPVLDGGRAAAVAAELGLSVNAVLIAKSRVLSRLRQERRGLLD